MSVDIKSGNSTNGNNLSNLKRLLLNVVDVKNVPFKVGIVTPDEKSASYQIFKELPKENTVRSAIDPFIEGSLCVPFVFKFPGPKNVVVLTRERFINAWNLISSQDVLLDASINEELLYLRKKIIDENDYT